MDQLLDTAEVCRVVGLSRQELWRRRRAGTFPEPVRLGGRRVGYSADEIQAWMKARIADRDALVAARKGNTK
jgi:prophage regulatory protein